MGAPGSARLCFLRLTWESTNPPCPILSTFSCRQGGKPQPSPSRVPHPFAPFATGWESTTLTQPLSTSHRKRCPRSGVPLFFAPNLGKHKPSVPHSVDFFLSTGWESTTLTQPLSTSHRKRCPRSGVPLFFAPNLGKHKPSVPHSVDFFLSTGWETTTLTQPLSPSHRKGCPTFGPPRRTRSLRIG
jgi:hypothetical protein